MQVSGFKKREALRSGRATARKCPTWVLQPAILHKAEIEEAVASGQALESPEIVRILDLAQYIKAEVRRRTLVRAARISQMVRMIWFLIDLFGASLLLDLWKHIQSEPTRIESDLLPDAKPLEYRPTIQANAPALI
jgi:hypothetical protein